MELPLVWIDLEMTGLDPERDVIVEIATIVTDGDLADVREGPQVVVHQPDDVLARMDEVVATMHRRSGLTDEVRSSAIDVAEAQRITLEFVREHVPEQGVAPLAGNSVHADRAFLRRFMPSLDRHLHYRNVDISTLKELARRWRPEALEGSPPKAEAHRALDDIRESLAELRHYRQALLGLP